MSLYNMLHGMNQAVFYILPMLGKHPDEYPRFRDCFVGDERHKNTKHKIIVYTRTGGANREAYRKENNKIRSMETYLFDYDDHEDNTFANFVFDVPEIFKYDFEVVFKKDKLLEISDVYKSVIYKAYPKLQKRLDEIFKK